MFLIYTTALRTVTNSTGDIWQRQLSHQGCFEPGLAWHADFVIAVMPSCVIALLTEGNGGHAA